MMQKLALVAGGLAWGVLVFAIGFKVNFPRDALLERLRYEVQDRGEGKWALDAGSADIWFLHGVEFDDLVVYKVEALKKPRPKKRRGKAKLDDGGEDAGEGALKGSHTRQYKGIAHAMQTIARQEGLRGLQAGLAPALVYQTLMNGTRLGMYEPVQRSIVAATGADPSSIVVKVLAAATSGGMGAALGSPIYMIKSRLQAQR